MGGSRSEWAEYESRSAPSDEDWADAVRRYTEGRVVEGRVFSRHPFGLFVDLGEPTIGLIEGPMLRDHSHPPLSQDDYPPIGSHVRAVVIGATDHNRQIRLSMRPADLERAPL